MHQMQNPNRTFTPVRVDFLLQRLIFDTAQCKAPHTRINVGRINISISETQE